MPRIAWSAMSCRVTTVTACGVSRSGVLVRIAVVVRDAA
jgi:hypothetical protein